MKVRTFRRPILSPSHPQKTPPSGRATKVIAKVPCRYRAWTVGSALGRKTGPIVVMR